MNILGIDFGQKRIGLAWMQVGLDVILPFGVVQNSPAEIVPKELVKLIEEERINKVVIGLPLGMEGEENMNTKRVRAFREELKKQINLPIEFIDERFTTHEASRMEGTASVDEKSAMLILESYIDTIRNENSDFSTRSTKPKSESR